MGNEGKQKNWLEYALEPISTIEKSVFCLFGGKYIRFYSLKDSV